MKRSSWIFPWLGLLLGAIAVSMIRFRLLDLPLERDEGGYAYFGQLILDGIPPFAGAYDTKLPGIYYLYAAVIGVFGASPSGIHAGLLIINLATMLGLFLLGRRLGGAGAGAFAGVSYGVLALSPWVQGPWAHLEHYLIASVVIAFWLLVEGQARGERGRLFVAGLLAGFALIIKHPALVFVVLGACCLALGLPATGPEKGPSRGVSLVLFLAGTAVAPLLEVAHIVAVGVWEQFRLWTFDYPARHISDNSFAIGWEILKRRAAPIISAHPVIFCLGLAGLFLPLRLVGARLRRILFLWLFLSVSLVAVSPGLFFRPHYFILLLPAVSLLAGSGLAWLAKGCKLILPWWMVWGIGGMVVAAALGGPFYRDGDFFFRMNPFEASRMTYQANPFPESVVIADYIRENTRDGDKIAVLGSEPQIYVYADRRAVTRYIFTYALMENQPWARRMQEEMIREIEEGEPVYLVSVNLASSWLPRRRSEGLIFEWAAAYVAKHYDQVGVVQIPVSSPPVFLWGPEAARLSSRTPNSFEFRRPSITIFRRRGDGERARDCGGVL